MNHPVPSRPPSSGAAACHRRAAPANSSGHCRLRLALAALPLLAFSHCAFAQYKLFITDVLDPGEQAILGGIAANESTADIRVLPAARGKAEREITRAFATYSRGFAPNWQGELSVGHSFVDDTVTELRAPVRQKTVVGKPGLQDLSFGLKYRPLRDDEGPYGLAARIDIKPRNSDANEAGTGSTNVGLSLAGSVRTTRQRFFVAASPTLRTDGMGNTYTLSAGFAHAFSPSLAINFSINAARNTRLRAEEPYNTRGWTLNTYIKATTDWVVIPTVVYTALTSRKSSDGRTSIEAGKTWGAGVAVYRAF